MGRTSFSRILDLYRLQSGPCHTTLCGDSFTGKTRHPASLHWRDFFDPGPQFCGFQSTDSFECDVVFLLRGDIPCYFWGWRSRLDRLPLEKMSEDRTSILRSGTIWFTAASRLNHDFSAPC